MPFFYTFLLISHIYWRIFFLKKQHNQICQIEMVNQVPGALHENYHHAYLYVFEAEFQPQLNSSQVQRKDWQTDIPCAVSNHLRSHLHNHRFAISAVIKIVREKRSRQFPYCRAINFIDTMESHQCDLSKHNLKKLKSITLP